MEKTIQLDQFDAIIGVDWADRKHDICLFDPHSKKTEFSQIKHDTKAIEAWVHQLKSRFKGNVILAIELKSGPLVYALLKYHFITIVPVPPKALSEYREAFTQSGAKDDPTDAYLAMDYLYKHFEKLNPIEPDTPETRHIQRLVEHRRSLVAERVRVTNRITVSLKEYYPQTLHWFNDLNTLLFCDFIERWPNLNEAKKARKSTLESFFHMHNSRNKQIIDQRIQDIKTTIPLTQDAGIIKPNVHYVLVQIKILRELIISIKQYDQMIAAAFKEHQEYELFNSFPGAGPVFAPRLLAAMGTNRKRFQSSDELVRYVGVAPVLVRSGKKAWVHFRYSCPKFIRQTFVEWAGYTMRESYWAKEYYDQQKAKGKPHNTILRSLAFKWARILYRCWKNNEIYDEPKYLLKLKERGSPLLN